MAEGKAKVHRLHVTTVSLFTRELFKQYNNEGKQKTHDVSHAWSLDWSHLISLQFSLNKTQFASFALFACVCVRVLGCGTILPEHAVPALQSTFVEFDDVQN